MGIQLFQTGFYLLLAKINEEIIINLYPVRQDMIDDYNRSEELFVFIISTRAGGMVKQIVFY